MANTFSSPPQSPVSVANPIECDWRAAGPDRGNITAYSASTNGLTEYTASNFGGQLKGDILTASFDNKVHRAKLNSTGTQLVSGQALFQNVGSTPLDIVTQGDGSIFPGTVWVADIGNGNITGRQLHGPQPHPRTVHGPHSAGLPVHGVVHRHRGPGPLRETRGFGQRRRGWHRVP
jgi:hypothetical protein